MCDKTVQDFFPTALQQPDLAKTINIKFEHQAKHLQKQIQPLSEQNINLKDYIIATNFYLQSRCKDFCGLLRDEPDRYVVKELGDLVTIYEMIKQDIEFYKQTITQFESSHQQLNTKVVVMIDREEKYIMDYNTKFDNNIKQTEMQKQELDQVIQDIKISNQQNTSELEAQLLEQQSQYQLKETECSQALQLIIAIQKQIFIQSQESQKEILQLESVIKEWTDKYNKDIRGLRDKHQFEVKEIKKNYKHLLDKLTQDDEIKLNQFKESWIKALGEIEDLKTQLEKLNHIQNRAKAMLELSKEEIRDNCIQIKNQTYLLVNHDLIVSKLENDIQLSEQTIQQLKDDIQKLIEELIQKELTIQMREQIWTLAMNEIFQEIKLISSGLTIPQIQLEQIDDTNYRQCIPYIQSIDQRLREEIQKNIELRDHFEQFQQDIKDLQSQVIMIRELKQKDILFWISKYDNILRKTTFILKRVEKEAILLKILKNNHSKILRDLKRDNIQKLEEVNKIKEVEEVINQINYQLASETQFLKFQKKMYNVKDPTKETDERDIITVTDEKEQELPWYMVDVMSENSLDNKDSPRDSLMPQSIIPVNSQTENQICSRCGTLRKEELVQISPLKSSLIYSQSPQKVQIKENQTISNGQQQGSTQSANKKDQKKNIPSNKQQSPNLLKDQKIPAKKPQSFKEPKWQQQHEVEVTQVIEEQKKSISDLIQQNRSLHQSRQSSISRMEGIQLLSEWVSSQGGYIDEVQMVSEPITLRSNQKIQLLQNQIQSVESMNQTQQLSSLKEDMNTISLEEQPQNKTIELQGKLPLLFRIKTINDEQERPSSILSDRSQLEPIVKEILRGKREKRNRVQSRRSSIPSEYNYQSVEEEKIILQCDKSIQALPEYKNKQNQTQNQDDDDYNAIQARHQDLIKNMDKKLKYQMSVMKQREESTLNELHLVQTKLNSFNSVVQNHDSNLLAYATKAEALQEANATLETQVSSQSNMLNSLKSQLQQQQGQYTQRLMIVMQTHKEQQVILLSDIQQLDGKLKLKEIEIQQKVELYFQEVNGRLLDNEMARILLDEERKQFKQEIFQLEAQAKIQNEAEVETVNQIKYLKETNKNRPSRQEDLMIIQDLTQQGLKLGKSLQENHNIIMHANEIVKYLQLELNNYKTVYNIFQHEQKIPQDGPQLNVENMRKQMFGKAYQNQYAKMMELQKFLDQEDDNQKINLSFNLQKPGISTAYPQKRRLSQNQIQNLPKLNEGCDTTDRQQILPMRYFTKEQYNQRDPLGLNITQDMISKKATPFTMKSKYENSCRQTNPNITSKNIEETKLKKKQTGIIFHNPFDNDNILLHADQFLKSVQSDPHKEKKSQKQKNNTTFNGLQTYQELTENQLQKNFQT